MCTIIEIYRFLSRPDDLPYLWSYRIETITDDYFRYEQHISVTHSF
jgi:hypothetical protein